MSTISGTVSDACRIHIYDLTNNELEVDEEIPIGTYSYEGLESNEKWCSAMRLSDGKAISYGLITPTADPPVEVDFPVLIDEDDGFLLTTTSTFYNTGWNTLRLANTNYWVIIRIDNVTIPKNSTILEAWLNLTWDTVETDHRAPVWADVYVENAVDPAIPADVTDFLTRTRLPNPVTIGSATSLTAETYIPFETPSLITPVQTIVNQSSWAQGNAISFHIDKTSGTYTNGFTSYSSGNGISSLHVKYQSG
jgi:hypothetical protein